MKKEKQRERKRSTFEITSSKTGGENPRGIAQSGVGTVAQVNKEEKQKLKSKND